MNSLAHNFVDVPAELSEVAMRLLSTDLVQKYRIVPWRKQEDAWEIFALEPESVELEELIFLLDCDVRLMSGDEAKIKRLLDKYWGEQQQVIEPDAAELARVELEALAGQAPVVQLVNSVFAQAVREKASDIHFEPFEGLFRIRCRVDGVLRELPPPPRELALAVISRIKVLAHLDIAERRVPQDGRIRMNLGGHAVDLRVSTLPTQFGESVVLRVLDQSAVQLSLEQLGMPADVMAGVREAVRRPNGIFIVTGPTGSGKTTTLYSALSEINTTDTKVLTAEDPVEYEIEGMMQVPVNPLIGLDFAAALKSFLRNDPDVLMIGEIRDLETAQMAIQASLTGHVVLATLHTNDAPSAVTRLIEMGVEPFLIAETLSGVLAQRLVRRVCVQCHSPQGCPACKHIGYQGRTGLFEWLPISGALKEAIGTQVAAQDLRRLALGEGMRSLRMAAEQSLAQGLTTQAEIDKYL